MIRISGKNLAKLSCRQKVSSCFHGGYTVISAFILAIIFICSPVFANSETDSEYYFEVGYSTFSGTETYADSYVDYDEEDLSGTYDVTGQGYIFDMGMNGYFSSWFYGILGFTMITYEFEGFLEQQDNYDNTYDYYDYTPIQDGAIWEFKQYIGAGVIWELPFAPIDIFAEYKFDWINALYPGFTGTHIFAVGLRVFVTRDFAIRITLEKQAGFGTVDEMGFLEDISDYSTYTTDDMVNIKASVCFY